MTHSMNYLPFCLHGCHYNNFIGVNNPSLDEDKKGAKCYMMQARQAQVYLDIMY